MTTKSNRIRTAPQIWKQIFQIVTQTSEYENGITLDLIHQAANELNHDIARESIRVKMHKYSKRDYIKKIGRGQYQIGPNGIRFFSLNSPSAATISDSKWAPRRTAWDNKKLKEIQRKSQ